MIFQFVLCMQLIKVSYFSTGQLERSISRDAAKTSTSANVDAVKDLQKPDEEEKGKMIDKEISETGRVRLRERLQNLTSSVNLVLRSFP